VTPSHRIRQIGTGLAVAFLLAAVWAAYGTYSEFHSSGTGSAPILATYDQESYASFVASLSPSYLYNNSTEIHGGNVTLFTPITHWINVTIIAALSTNRTAALSLREAFSVVLSTPAWSKLLFSTLNGTSVPAGTAATLETRYDVNVSEVVALVSLINGQLNYQTTTFTLSLDPLFYGSVQIPGQQQSLNFEPVLNFTFLGSLITPSGLTFSATGTMVGPVPNDSAGLAGELAIAILIAALIGVGVSTWIATRREPELTLPPLDQLIEPYEEAVATTGTVPAGAAATDVADFTDLVKIADTLGKPILRPTESDPAKRALYVVDGTTVYRYVYPASEGEAPAPGSPALPVAVAQRRYRTPNAERLARQLGREIERFQSLSLDDHMALMAIRRARRAADLLEVGHEREAELEIIDLARFLSWAGEAPRRRGAR
jgi:hypothetical protein